MGCEAYQLSARLRGVARHVTRIDPADVAIDGAGVVHFTHPLCSECRDWERRLRAEDSRRRGRVAQPRLAHKYGVAVVPTVVAVAGDGRSWSGSRLPSGTSRYSTASEKWKPGVGPPWSA